MDAWGIIADERRTLADLAAGFQPAQWDTPSLCEGWTVKDVVAHLDWPVQPRALLRFLPLLAAARGDFDQANRVATARRASLPTAELVADLRARADARLAPPGLGVAAPLTDVLVHGEDIRIPLGLHADRPAERWEPVLSFLASPKARRGFVPTEPPALRYVATDTDWSGGTGDEEVRAPAAALALAFMGRKARLAELDGPGADTLRQWVARG